MQNNWKRLINFNNSAKGLCVVCTRPIAGASTFVCSKCNKPCEVKEVGPRSYSKDEKFLSDWKSKCCDADILMMQKNTCSKECHETFVQELEDSFGKYKQVIDINTGVAHQVPTRDIIEKGLTYRDLQGYPIWVDAA